MKRIAIHSVPRSGSTWLGSVFDSSPNVVYRFQPLFSFGHKGELSADSNKEDINNYFNNIVRTKDEFVLQKEAIEKKIVPKFEKQELTHIVYKEVRYHNILKNLLHQDKEIVVVGIVRSPFSVISSWLSAPKEFRPDLGWKLAEEWKDAPKKNLDKKEEFNGYNKWKEVCFMFLDFQKNYPNQFYLINYGNLITNTETEVKKLFEFCSLEYTKQTRSFLQASTSKESDDAYAVFKKKKMI